MRLSFKPNIKCSLHETCGLWRFLFNVQTSKQRGKKLAVGRGPSDCGGSIPWYNRHSG